MAPHLNEPCEFRILQMSVSEDVALITRQFDKLVADNRVLENSTNPQHRSKFKGIIDAGTALKDARQRKAIVDAHTSDFEEYVKQFCFALQGSITTENREFLIEQGQGATYHLSLELCVASCDRALADAGTTVGGHNPAPVRPTVISGLAVDLVDGWPHLRWQRPAQGCDRIVIRAAQGAYPADDLDGREVFDGLADECLDTRAVAGKRWYYSAFSFVGTRSSSPECAKSVSFFGAPVTGLQATGGLRQIAVSWRAPAVEYKDIIVFRSPAGSAGVAIDGDGMPRPLTLTRERRMEKANAFVDDERSGIEPGVAYEYSIFVDYGLVDTHVGWSPGRSVVAAAVPVAKPVTDLTLESTEAGILARWQLPSSHCDSVVVVRSTQRSPSDERDGVPVALDGKTSHLDGGLGGGTEYYYAVFSVHQGHASARTVASTRYAPPPTGFTAADPAADPGHIRLQWAARNSVKALRLFKRKGQRPEIVMAAGAPTCVNGQVVALGPGRSTEVRDRVDPDVEYHYVLFADYGAGAWSPPVYTSARAARPTRPVAAVRAGVSPAGQVSLAWSAPDPAAGAFDYHVWRREPGRDREAPQGERIATIRQTSFVDRAPGAGDPPLPGRAYEYAVQSAIGRVNGELSPWTPVFVTRDVVLKSVTGVDRAVTLEWIPPPNVARIEVKRDGSNAIVAADLSRAHDHGLSLRTVYTYTITAIFAGAHGEELRAPGVRATAMPVTPADVVRNPRLRYEHDAVVVSWTPPVSVPHAILVSRVADPPSLEPGAFVDRSTLGAVTELPGAATCFEDRDPTIGGVHLYAIFTMNGSTATYCGTVTAPLFPAVRDLEITNMGTRIWLTWKWPAGADLVRVTRRSWDMSDASTRSCTRQQYDSAASVFVDIVADGPARYTYEVRVSGVHGTTRCESLLASSKSTPGGVLPRIACTAQKKKQTFAMTCSLGGVPLEFGGLALVGSNTRDPLSIDEGEVVARFVPNGRLPSKVTLRDERPGGPYRYYQIFLLEPDPLKSMVELVPAPLVDRGCA